MNTFQRQLSIPLSLTPSKCPSMKHEMNSLAHVADLATILLEINEASMRLLQCKYLENHSLRHDAAPSYTISVFIVYKFNSIKALW